MVHKCYPKKMNTYVHEKYCQDIIRKIIHLKKVEGKNIPIFSVILVKTSKFIS